MSRLLLLAAAVSTAACDAGVLPPLSAAARRGDLAVMRRWLDAGADPDEPGEGGTRWPPLMHAVHKRQIAAARLLLERGANPNAAGPRGYTALMMAAAANDPAMVSLLLDFGADPHRVGPGHITAFSEAVTGGAAHDVDGPLLGACHPATVQALLDRAPDLTLPDGEAGAETRFWMRLHAGLQKMRNLALVPTTGAAPDITCGIVMQTVERRHP